MATYFHGGSEIQANSEGIHTLYLMNPNYVPYTDTHSQTPPNMLFLNPSSHALTPSTLPHAPPSSNHFVGIPLPTTDAPRPSFHHEISALHSVPAQRLHYNLWAPMDPSHQGISATAESADLGFRRQATQQGLSLTLSSQQSLYRTVSAEQEIQGGGGGGAAGISPRSGDEIRVSGNSPTSVSVVSSSGITGVQSKYLKAAQELLDEVVNVGKGNFYKSDKGDETKDKMKMKMKKESSTAAIAETTSKPPPPDLTTAQRQDLQMKKAKLIGMLDEVEQKYRQYHEQMQGVVSSFEQAAGLGSAKSYAWLALQTISKQFRCLKDAICAQIKATGKSLGEDQDNWLGGKIEGSRLRYVDHHLRQQRALQQLGMIQHNTWRPQRGLPERAVSVLRAWLFEHFLHPYPKDSDKIILAKQTGLTRSQVSNWFINARVRLWKPMVEEMYLEEIKDQEQNGDSHDTMNRNNKKDPNKQHGGDQNNNASSEAFKLNHQMKDPQSKTENLMNNHNNNVSNSSILGSLQTHSGFNLVRPSSDILSSPKKPRTTNNQLETTPSTKTMLCRDINDTKHLIQTTAEMNMNTTTTAATNNHNNHGGGFGSYPIGEIGSRFNSELLTPRFHANGVSLTLGLPHSDHNLSLSGTQQNYLSNRNLQLANGQPPDHFSDINPPPPPPHSASTAYDAVDIQTTKRFAAQLLPDFVA